MQEFIENWGHLGVFLSILATGFGFPVPEELPIVAAGAMVNHGKVYWYTMLPVCIAGVILGDAVLYCIGRFWGARLIELSFVRKKLLTPERFASIAENFQKYGVKILLFARLTPGIRTPIFLTAGITKLPITYFILADAIYAVPGVSLLFVLGYWFTDNMIGLIEEAEYIRLIVLAILTGVGLYLVYRFWMRPVVTGNPTEMPPLVGGVTQTLDHVAESVAGKVLHRSSASSPEIVMPPPSAPPAESNGVLHPPLKENLPTADQPLPPSEASNGLLHPPAEVKTPAEKNDKMAG